MSKKLPFFSPAFQRYRSRGDSSTFSEGSAHQIPRNIRQGERAAALRESDENIIAQALQGGVEFDGILLLKASALIQEFRSPGQALSNKGRNQRPSM